MTVCFPHAKAGEIAGYLPDGTPVSALDVEVIDLDTGKPPVDEAGRPYPILEAWETMIEVYDNYYQPHGTAEELTLRDVSGRFEIRTKNAPR